MNEVIFVFKHLKREIRFLTGGLRAIILAAFLCALGGVILWINGGSAWYFIRASGGSTPPISLIFSVWVFAYALCGGAAAMIWLVYRRGKCSVSHALPCFGLSLVSYLFMLIWYALFFCTRLTVFAAIILILSVLIDFLLVFLMRKTLIIFSFLMIVIILVQVFFICFSFALI